MGEEIERIRSELGSISERLADLAMDRIRDAMDPDAPSHEIDERLLSRARRSVEKASMLLTPDRERDW